MKAALEMHFLSELHRLVEHAETLFTRIQSVAGEWNAHDQMARAPRPHPARRLSDEESKAYFHARVGLGSAQFKLFFDVDAFLDTVARVSLVLFPTRSESRARGRYLRELLHIPEDSVFGNRDARNGWHHVDEGLDEFENEVITVQQFVRSNRLNSLMQLTTYRLLVVDALQVLVRGRNPVSLSEVAAPLKSLRGAIQEASESWGDRHGDELGTIEDYL